MARTLIFTPFDAVQEFNLSLTRDEKLILAISTAAPDLALSISKTAGGDPLVELRSAGGAFTITPAAVATLIEGQLYQHNIWDLSDPSDPVRLAFGTLKCGASIAPLGVTYATAILVGGLAAVVLTAAQYEALDLKDPATLYFIVN
jgi:hypothetical protein